MTKYTNTREPGEFGDGVTVETDPISNERLAEMLVGLKNHGGAKLATIYTDDYASALTELQQRRASVVTPGSVLDQRPNIGATTPEPSLREIVQHYYKGSYSNAVADDLTNRYFAALSVVSHETGERKDHLRLARTALAAGEDGR